MIPKATPVYEGFWKNSDLDILSRLHVASEELKAKGKNPEGKPLRSHLPMERTKLMKLMKKIPTLTGQNLYLYRQVLENDLRDNLDDTMSKVLHGTCDTSDKAHPR